MTGTSARSNRPNTSRAPGVSLIDSTKRSDVGELIGQPLEVGAAEHVGAVVVLAAPVGRIQVEQHLRPIIAPDQVGIAQALDRDRLQPIAQTAGDRRAA